MELKDPSIRPFRGMESVIATVSGYHGTERFKVIQLIQCCGASYVGATNNNSITHLVCFQFEGKKYEFARKKKIHIVSHCWFEDCLKQGRRLPEDPYTMQSGQEVGPISWKVPAILECNVKKSISHFGERNVESSHYKALHLEKGKEIDAACLNWSDSRLLKEISFDVWDNKNVKKKLSNPRSCRKSIRVLERSHPYNKHQIAIIDDPSSWPESSSSPSSTRLRRRRNFHFDAYAGVNTGPTDAVNIKEPMDHEENMKKTNGSSNLVDQNGYERFHLVTTEANPKVTNSVEIRTGSDLFESGERKGKRRDCNVLSSPSALDKQAELSCVICWTEFCSSRGVLPCGHRFCYSCIQEWADCMASRGKMSTCPLCKSNFTSITKFEDLASSEQKIFSQTVPCNSLKLGIFCLPDSRYDNFRAPYSDSVCFECQHHEPEDLLLKCHICRSQWVHSCCLDPPLLKWTCIHCRDPRMLYQRFR